MNSMVKNVLLSGVGGQGTILASDLLSEAMLSLGYDVKKSEVHGLAQRGGAVVTQVRFGKKVYSPIVPEGSADFLVAFELVEAARYVGYLRSDAVILVSDKRIPSATILAGLEGYPADPLAGVREAVKECAVVPAAAEAEKLGNTRVANVIMLGAFAKRLGLGLDVFRDAIRKIVKPRFVELNLKAFEVGLKY